MGEVAEGVAQPVGVEGGRVDRARQQPDAALGRQRAAAHRADRGQRAVHGGRGGRPSGELADRGRDLVAELVDRGLALGGRLDELGRQRAVATQAGGGQPVGARGALDGAGDVELPGGDALRAREGLLLLVAELARRRGPRRPSASRRARSAPRRRSRRGRSAAPAARPPPPPPRPRMASPSAAYGRSVRCVIGAGGLAAARTASAAARVRATASRAAAAATSRFGGRGRPCRSGGAAPLGRLLVGGAPREQLLAAEAAAARCAGAASRCPPGGTRARPR